MRRHSIEVRVILRIAAAFVLVSVVMLVTLSSSTGHLESRNTSDVAAYIKSSIVDCERSKHGFLPFNDDAGSIRCQEAKKLSQQGKWVDPNNGRVYLRSLISEPSFHVSVHNSTYDLVRWGSIFEEGKYYEDLVHSRFVQILSGQPESLVLDVGANIGYYTLLSLALGHNVIGFEINPANILRICESLTFNKWDHDRVAIFQKGVSDTDGASLQVLVPRNPGQAYLKEVDDVESLHRLQQSNNTSAHHAFTTTVTLDQFALDRGWFRRPNFTIAILKLDVEGKEPQIVQGSRKLLKSGIINNVLTEFRRLARETVQEAIATLFESGYTIVHESRGKLKQADAIKLIESMTEEFKGKQRNFDIWFQLAA